MADPEGATPTEGLGAPAGDEQPEALLRELHALALRPDPAGHAPSGLGEARAVHGTEGLMATVVHLAGDQITFRDAAVSAASGAARSSQTGTARRS